MKYLFFILFLSPSLLFSQSFKLSSFQENDFPLTLEQAKKIKFNNSPSNSINYGFDGKPIWVKLEDFELPSEQKYILTSLNAITDSVTAYIIYQNEVQVKHFGSRLESFQERYKNPLAIDLNPDIQTVYIRMTSHTFIRDVFKIKTIGDFETDRLGFLIFIAFVIGVLLILTLYNLVLYFKLQEIGHFYYASFACCISFLFMYVEGIGALFVWRSYPSVIVCFEPILLGLACFSIASYTFWLLKSRSKLTWQDKFLNVIRFLPFSLIILAIVLSPINASLTANIFTNLIILSILLYGVSKLIAKNPYAKYFLVGWSIFMVSSVGRNLFNAGAIEYYPVFDFLNYSGVIVEAFVFTWLISKRIKDSETQLELKTLQLTELSENLDLLTEQLRLSQENDENKSITIDISSMDLKTYLIDPLSKREEEVLQILAKGLTYQEIADQLFISKNTVKTHVIKIYEKLDAKNRTEAINKAKHLRLA